MSERAQQEAASRSSPRHAGRPGRTLGDTTNALTAARRIVFVGRTGSGKTTLAREVAAILGRRHVELDALHFRDDLSTVPLEVLRARTAEVVDDESWVVDGNKSSVRDLVWPRAEVIVWLDYPLAVSVWRLGRRAVARARRVVGSRVTPRPELPADDPDARERDVSARARQRPADADRWRVPRHLLAAARGVLRALRSHAGQRRTFPALFASPEYAHLEVIRLRSPRATRRWLNALRDAVDGPATLRAPSSAARARRAPGAGGTPAAEPDPAQGER